MIDAMISVDPSSPFPLHVLGVGGTGGGNLANLYSLNMQEIFDYTRYPASIAPGQSITLHWGELIPFGSVPSGRYPGDSYDLGFEIELGKPGISMFSDNNFTVTVVPEPTSLSLTLAGLSFLLLLGLRNPRIPTSSPSLCSGVPSIVSRATLVQIKNH